MGQLVPDEEGGSHGNEVEMQDVVVVYAPIEVVYSVLENTSQMTDPQPPARRVEHCHDQRYDVEEVHAPPSKPAPLKAFEHVIPELATRTPATPRKTGKC